MKDSIKEHTIADAARVKTKVTAEDPEKLTRAIGMQVRALRKHRDLSVVECAKLSDMSAGMLSKIENGVAQPSLTSLHSLSKTFNVPLTSFFKKFEEDLDVCYTPPGEGMLIERRGANIGHQYYLLGHDVGMDFIAVTPYLIIMTDESEKFPVFNHSGIEFIYMLEGEMDYKHDDHVYHLTAGTSLFFEAKAPHGPKSLEKLPVKFLSVIMQPRME